MVEAGEEREEDLEAAALLLNNKAQALLQAGPGEAPGCRDAEQWRLVQLPLLCCLHAGSGARLRSSAALRASQLHFPAQMW